jgi:hypothetical protein
MSHPKGTDLGGVRSVDRLRERCVIDDETGCWHWKFGTSHGRPQLIISHPAVGEHIRMSGARAAWVLSNGRTVPEGQIVRLRCRSLDCCNPEHTKATTRTEWGKHIAKVGANKCDPLRRAQITRDAQARSKLNREIVSEIRASDRPAREEAARHGIAMSTVTAIRRRTRWKDALTASSVFNLAGVA